LQEEEEEEEEEEEDDLLIGTQFLFYEGRVTGGTSKNILGGGMFVDKI
jgi:hypothetical protein